MAAAGLAVSWAMLCLEGSPRKLKILIQLHAQPQTAIPKEQAPSMGKAPTGVGHVHAGDWEFTRGPLSKLKILFSALLVMAA